MSKITPKNLHYDTTLPPFLARMQANQAGRDDRHEFDVARPRKARDAAADAEDEPVYVDEATGDSLTKGEWEEREKKKEEEEEKVQEKTKEEQPVGERKRENMAVIGGAKKRKMGKVVGAEESAGEEGDAPEKASKPGKKQEKGKAGKKGKKIKLSFGDDE